MRCSYRIPRIRLVGRLSLSDSCYLSLWTRRLLSQYKTWVLGTKQPHLYQNSINTNIISNVYPRIIAPQSSELNFTVTSRIIGFYRILTHFDNQTTITIRVLLRGVIVSKNRKKVNNRPGYYSSSVFVVF